MIQNKLANTNKIFQIKSEKSTINSQQISKTNLHIVYNPTQTIHIAKPQSGFSLPLD